MRNVMRKHNLWWCPAFLMLQALVGCSATNSSLCSANSTCKCLPTFVQQTWASMTKSDSAKNGDTAKSNSAVTRKVVESKPMADTQKPNSRRVGAHGPSSRQAPCYEGTTPSRNHRDGKSVRSGHVQPDAHSDCRFQQAAHARERVRGNHRSLG
jgi:hypothetical protein